MAVIIFESSRYRYLPLTQDGDQLRIPAFRSIQKTDYPDNVHIRIKDGDRLDQISYKLYGTTRYDWVIADFNNIKFAVTDLSGIDTIVAPSFETLFNIILVDLQKQLDSFDL